MKERNDIEIVKPRNISPSARSTNKIAVVGIEDEIWCIKPQLIGSSLELYIISIVGVGSIGKTTLARKIYNDSVIASHFDIRSWVTVSKYFMNKKYSNAFYIL